MGHQNSTLLMSTSQVSPAHIALIMDGNGRWALRQGLTRHEGHQAATANLLDIVKTCADLGVNYLTLYTFSTENWRRPAVEVSGMFRIMGEFLDREAASLHALGVKLRHLGSMQDVPPVLQQRAEAAIALTRHNTRLCLNVAFNYGGRADLLHAIQQALRAATDNPHIDDAQIAAYLSTSGLPDPDLVIRTSGEKRLSNFLLWETAYSVCWSTPILWPDFRPEHLVQAIAYYHSLHQRERCVGM